MTEKKTYVFRMHIPVEITVRESIGIVSAAADAELTRDLLMRSVTDAIGHLNAGSQKVNQDICLLGEPYLQVVQ